MTGKRSLPTLTLILLWLATLLSMPFIEIRYGETAFTLGIVLSVIFQSLAVFSIMLIFIGITRAVEITCKVVALTLMIEVIGVNTGFPFGDYHYTNRLQPQFLGVPILIPFAWFMMLPPSWAVAQSLIGHSSRFKFSILSGLVFTMWDLFLDPQMVKWSVWNWKDPNGYFGIPYTNFVGWLLTSTLITIIVHPGNFSNRLLLLVYALTWLMETVGLIIFWGLWMQALIGSVGMGGFVFLACILELRKKHA